MVSSSGSAYESPLISPSFQAYYLLSRAPYEIRGNVKKFGINKLLDSGVYKAAYPLHDVTPRHQLTHTCSGGRAGG